MGIDYNKTPSASSSGGGVSLSKVTLTKANPTVSLTKGGDGLIKVNLNWHQGTAAPARGLFKRRSGGGNIDLDLGCLYEFTGNDAGVVQALGKSFEAYAGGARNDRPVIRLDGDDRSGANTGGENLLIDGAQSEHIRRILVFAYIYEGVPNWAEADGVVTLTQPAGPPIEVRLDEPDPRSRFCAIALITNQGGTLQVERQVRYIDGSQADLDRAYTWGLRWAPARK